MTSISRIVWFFMTLCGIFMLFECFSARFHLGDGFNASSLQCLPTSSAERMKIAKAGMCVS